MDFISRFYKSINKDKKDLLIITRKYIQRKHLLIVAVIFLISTYLLMNIKIALLLSKTCILRIFETKTANINFNFVFKLLNRIN